VVSTTTSMGYDPQEDFIKVVGNYTQNKSLSQKQFMREFLEKF
jgi:hypothetical protein